MPTGTRAVLKRVWDRLPERPKRWVQEVRYPAAAERQWMRTVMNADADAFFASLPPDDHDAMEVSGRIRAGLPWKSYTSLGYPDFDLCAPEPPPETYDIVICEQVLEHVPDLDTAVGNLYALCRPSGRVFVSTPFLVKIHGHPGDYWRLTPSGLRIVLERGGFEVEWVRSWGNRSCARRNLRTWVPYRPWSSLRNDPDVPVVVWAVGRRPA